jgi:hypothetical protein
MSEALLGYFLEPAAVAIQDDRLIGHRVPLANHVHVLGIEFEAIADALSSSAAASVVPLPRKGSYTISPRGVIQDRGRISSTGFCVG